MRASDSGSRGPAHLKDASSSDQESLPQKEKGRGRAAVPLRNSALRNGRKQVGSKEGKTRNPDTAQYIRVILPLITTGKRRYLPVKGEFSLPTKKEFTSS